MKLFTILLLAALLGSSIAAPRRKHPRMSEESDESQEAVELEADEVEVEVPQDDDASDEEEDDDPPPKFHELFPTPKKAGVATHGPQNLAFANMLQEIEQNGWKRPKGIKAQNQRRQRDSLKKKPVLFRADDDDDSDEDEEDDDTEDDEPFAPDFDTMFPNPEGKPSGPQNLPQLDLGGPASVESVRYRSESLLGVTGGRSQSSQPMYYVASSGNRRPASSRPQMDRAPMTPMRQMAYRTPNGNRRVSSSSSFPVSYMPQKQQVVSYRPQMSYRPRQPTQQQQVVYVPQRQQQQYVQMPYRQRQPMGPVYYVQQVQRQPQYYYQSSNRRNSYAPMIRQQTTSRRPSSGQTYGQRMRSNNNNWYYWN